MSTAGDQNGKSDIPVSVDADTLNTLGHVTPKVDLDEVEKAWLDSSEHERAARFLRISRTLLRVAVAGLLIGIAVVVIAILTDNIDVEFPIGLIVGGAALYLSVFRPVAQANMRQARRRFIEREEAIVRAVAVKRAAARVDDALSLPNLFGFNRTLMDEYHSITKGQSERSFRYSQVASFIGLFVLGAGASVAFTPVSDITRITVGGLAGVGTVISGYISKTFLRSHELSIRQLNNFFKQPLISNYLLMAERLTNELGVESKSQARLLIIEKIIESARNAEGSSAFSSHPPPFEGRTASKKKIKTNDAEMING
jgi:hypothetical protein